MKKNIIQFLIGIFVVGIFFRIFCGIFVIQPIGAIPEGATIVYWRSGINLNLDFISSPDGILEKSGAGVSLLGRVVILGKVAEPIKKREIFRLNYSEALYLLSTGGKKYEN
jgi:hypothetical protein